MADKNRIKHAFKLLSEENFGEAKEIFDSLAENGDGDAEIYIGRLLAENEMSSEENLRASSKNISQNENFIKALELSEGERREELISLEKETTERHKMLSVYDLDFLEKIYSRAKNCEETSESYAKNANILRSIGGYRDATTLSVKYEARAAELKVIEEKALEEAKIREAEAREEKRRRSDAAQIKFYSIGIAVLSVFLVFLICYNLFLKDMIAKNKVLDEIAPLTYDDIVVMDEKSAPWFFVSKEGVLSFYKDNYTGDGNLVIPDVFENRLVKYIERGAFKDCKNIVSVKMSNFIIEVGSSAFENCVALEKVEISTSLKNISMNMFYGCTSLKSVTLPDSVESIDSHSFGKCTSLTEIKFGPNFSYIGKFAFLSCTSMKTFYLPATVSRIDTNAFSKCENLKDVIYGGNEEDFEKISISVGNGLLTEANITYEK